MIINTRDVLDKHGVYILKSENNKILYVGKANSLKKRLNSYNQLQDDPRITRLIEKTKSYETFEVYSELEALILEANLIKKYLPPFNVQLKDDKDYLYIKITKEKFPKVLPTRKKFLRDAKFYFGPFPSSRTVRSTLKIIRKIFPYSTCKSNSKSACLHYHLGLCPGVCIGKIKEAEYQRNINNIRLFFSGKKASIIKNLSKEMDKESKRLRYESASALHQKIRDLEYILQPRNEVTKYTEDLEFLKSYRLAEIYDLKDVLEMEHLPLRIEGYDISNIHGKDATGSMVVIANGATSKEDYRKFRIKTVRGYSDTDMIEEILRRRFHNDWPYPDLIVLDGGKGQLSAGFKVLAELKLDINCIALAKKFERIYIKGKKNPISLPRDSKALHVLQRLRD